MIPEKAIICAPTAGEARVLFDLLGREGYRFGTHLSHKCHTGWSTYGEETCYNLDINKHICYSDTNFFRLTEDEFVRGELDEFCSRWFPEDPQLRFISVSDFVAYCTGAQTPEDEDFDIGDLL